MARGKVISIDEKIKKAQDNVVKTKEKYDAAVAELQELMAKKKAMQSEELMKLFTNSGRSYDEVVEFLKSGMTEEQLTKITQKKRGRKPKNSF